MSTVVVTKFITSEAYQADQHVTDDGMKLIASCDGILANYHGIRLGDASIGYTIQVATSPEAFVSLVSNKELFNNIEAKMSIGRVGAIQRYDFSAISDPFKALVGPVTEITHWTLKKPTPENKQSVDTILTHFNKVMDGKMTYGWSAEDPNTCIVLVAWDTVEAPPSEPGADDGLSRLSELADPIGGHLHRVKLARF